MQQMIFTSVSNSTIRFPINISIIFIPKFQNYTLRTVDFPLKKKCAQLFIPLFNKRMLKDVTCPYNYII